MAWPDSPCPTCPRAARGLSLPCRAQATLHRRFCELADPTHPDHSPAYIDLLCDVEPAPRAEIPRDQKPRVPLGTRPAPGGD